MSSTPADSEPTDSVLTAPSPPAPQTEELPAAPEPSLEGARSAADERGQQPELEPTEAEATQTREAVARSEASRSEAMPPRADLFDAIDLVGSWRLDLLLVGQTRSLSFEARIAESGDLVTFELFDRGRQQEIALAALPPDAVFLWNRQTPNPESTVRSAQPLELRLRLASEGRLTGSLSHPESLFELEVQGFPQSSPSSSAENDATPGTEESAVERLVSSSDGHSMRLDVPKLDSRSADYLKARDLDVGETLTWLEGPPVTLETDQPLQSIDSVLPPGHYSLWLRRTSRQDWILIANDRIGPVGNLHAEGGDVAVWDVETGSTDTTYLRGSLEATSGNATVLRLAWGEYSWTVRLRPAVDDPEEDALHQDG